MSQDNLNCSPFSWHEVYFLSIFSGASSLMTLILHTAKSTGQPIPFFGNCFIGIFRKCKLVTPLENVIVFNGEKNPLFQPHHIAITKTTMKSNNNKLPTTTTTTTKKPEWNFLSWRRKAHTAHSTISIQYTLSEWGKKSTILYFGNDGDERLFKYLKLFAICVASSLWVWSI